MGNLEKAMMDFNLPFPQIGKRDWKKGIGNKINELYNLSEFIPGIGLKIATDCISADDHVLLTGILGKGKSTHKISAAMFRTIGWTCCPNHFITDKLEEFPKSIQKEIAPFWPEIEGRAMLILLADQLLVEPIVRNRITGSVRKEYLENGTIGGVPIPAGIENRGLAPASVLTPSTKETGGKHDRNINYDQFVEVLGDISLARLVKAYSLSWISDTSLILAMKGFTVIDGKPEFGIIQCNNYLVPKVPMQLFQTDEISGDTMRLEPDLTKEPFRKKIREVGYDGEHPIEVPDWLVKETSHNYRELCLRITGENIAL